MWSSTRRPIDDRSGEILCLAQDERSLLWAEVIAGWRDDKGFRDFFIAELAASPHPAFFWETPPLQTAILEKPFASAVIRSTALAGTRADDSDFAEQLAGSDGPVASFRNLGGDALLVVPKRISAVDCYAHMAAFVREGPREQQHALFQCVAAEAGKLLATQEKFWISTSGLGVPWLHVRLDTHPKYYQHRPYAER